MKVARPLVWHDARQSWPKRLLGGSCFILRFDAGLIGVTAEHVIKAFEKTQIEGTSTVCLLRTVLFDLTGRIIDRDPDLDIATFAVTENELVKSEAIEVDCRSAWPPPVPDIGRELSLAGFPEEFKKDYSYHRFEFHAYVSLSRVEDITDRDIIATFEPSRDFRVRAAPEFPDLGANLSACSGGPVLMHAERKGLHRWFPVGLIVGGPKDATREHDVPTDAAREFDIFRFRRIHFVNPDGSINHPNIGWLPR